MQSIAVLICFVVCLSGCFMTSTVVSSIGAREIYGEVKLDSSTQDISLEVKDAALDPFIGHGGASIPYEFLHRSKEYISIGDIKINYSEIDWKSQTDAKYGELKTVINNQPLIFNVEVVEKVLKA